MLSGLKMGLEMGSEVYNRHMYDVYVKLSQQAPV